MQKKKLSLNQIKVKSFITHLNSNYSETIKGMSVEETFGEECGTEYSLNTECEQGSVDIKCFSENLEMCGHSVFNCKGTGSRAISCNCQTVLGC